MPQIEVVFDIDSNGILIVSASDKSTGKIEKVTIKNDKGRLNQEDIEAMINDAEKFKEEDAMNAKIVEERNNLENYTYGIKSSLENDQLKDKFTEHQRTELNGLVEETQSWLDSNQNETAEAYETKRKELETIYNPIIQGIYQSQPEPAPASGPSSYETVEEVD